MIARPLPIPYCMPGIASFYLVFILFVSKTDQQNNLYSFKNMSVPPYGREAKGQIKYIFREET